MCFVYYCTVCMYCLCMCTVDKAPKDGNMIQFAFVEEMRAIWFGTWWLAANAINIGTLLYMCICLYFDFNFWRIDILRLSLAYAGIDYEFERIPRDDWIKFKHKQPFGQLPVMYYENNIYCHTHSLATFCASKSNLYSS